jgi:hypothetical protein
MSAIMSQIYNIDPSFDLTNIDSRELQHVWIATLPPEIEVQRQDHLQLEISEGVTLLQDFAMVLDKTARTYTRNRQYTTLAAAQERKVFQDSVIIPEVGAPFTIVSSTVLDDVTIVDIGFITLP